MIVVTGARGFIGSNLVEALNKRGLKNLILVDEQENALKDANLKQLDYLKFIERDTFLDWFHLNADKVDFLFHLGARTDTAEQDKLIFDELNFNYSKAIFRMCVQAKINLIYASSAATYGNGKFGYDDTLDIKKLQALNPYAQSKLDFDLWVGAQRECPPFWAGLKFFNVYGKNEEHKGRMASVIYHAFHQIQSSGKMKLFQSHKDGIANGEQSRDFIAVSDIVNVCLFFYDNPIQSGLYNAGTGVARSFNDLVSAVFNAVGKTVDIEYIPTPLDIRDAYQYFTQATTEKLRKAGYSKEFTSLETGVTQYVKNHLLP